MLKTVILKNIHGCNFGLIATIAYQIITSIGNRGKILQG